MEFPGNSHNPLGETKQPKAEPPPKDIQKVVTSEAIQRKKPLARRFKEVFFRGEFKEARRYVLTDVLLPALKNMVFDAGSEGLKRTLFGDSYSRRHPELGRPRISYNSPVDRDRYREPRSAMLPGQPPLASRRRQDIGEIILVSRAEAELVVERLTDIIDKYDVASVADLHDLAGLPSSYVENKWGWSSLRGAEVRQIREGFLIDLPPVEPI